MNKLALLWSLALLAGCWTLNETAYPETAVTGAPETEIPRAVALAGFEAYLTDYAAVQGYRTVYVPGYHGRYHCEPGHYEVVPGVDYIPQQRLTDLYLRRAQDTLEKAGYVIATTAERIVEVRFNGPYDVSGSGWARFAWNVCTLFLCDHDAMRWTATLRIRDPKTGKLLFHHDYEQVFEAEAMGLIPLFGASSCDTLSTMHMQSWCLAALTDRAIADATAFLATEK